MSRTANVTLLAALVAVIWAVELVNMLLGHRLNDYGLLPRTVEGLRGIPLSPLLHGGFSHALSNTAPLLILGGLAAVRGRGNFLLVTVFIILVGGAGVWVGGRAALHIGASGLVFGYFGYLVGRGWYERSILSIAVALAVIAVFGWGMLSGILPTAGVLVSWEGHLCGLIAGVLAAGVMGGRRERAAVRNGERESWRG